MIRPTLGLFRFFKTTVIQNTSILRFFKTVKDNKIDILPSKIKDPSNETLRFADLIKPLGFFVVVSGVSIAGCGIWQYENLKKQIKVVDTGFPKFGEFRQQISELWNRELKNEEKLIVFLMGMNFGVFCLWHIPKLYPMMVKYLGSHPRQGVPTLSMLLSTFSHYNAWHLIFNMIALYSFGYPTMHIMGREQFLAFFLMAGTFSSLTSYALKVLNQSRALSMGASGALMAMVGVVCMEYPNAELSLIFLPTFTFSAFTALKAMLIFDTMGIIMKWKLFDHAAHLGGLAFGVWYWKYGNKYLWSQREWIVDKWHEYKKRRLTDR